MDRFAPALRRVAGELDLPRRARTAVLLEMASDLEAVYEHHRGRGVPEDEATRRAEEAVLASSEVIRRLGRLHRSPWRGWAEEVGERLTGGFELLLLLVGVLPALVVSALVAGWVLRAGGSPLAWLLVVTGLVMVLTSTRSGGSGSARPGYARAGAQAVTGGGASPLLVLSAMASVIGLLALALGVQGTAATIAGASAPAVSAAVSAASIPASSPAVSPGGTAVAATAAARLAGDVAVLAAGLLLGLAGLLTWFVLVGREARRAADEVEELLGGLRPGPDIIPLVRRRQG